MLTGLIHLLQFALNLFMWAVILAAVVSTLIAFNVLDSRNRLVWTVADFLNRVTDPVLRPIRNLLPNLGGIDISPLVVIAVIQFLLQPLLRGIEIGILTGQWQPVFL